MTVWGCVREIKADSCRAVFGKTVWHWIREVTSVTGVGLGRSRV